MNQFQSFPKLQNKYQLTWAILWYVLNCDSNPSERIVYSYHTNNNILSLHFDTPLQLRNHYFAELKKLRNQIQISHFEKKAIHDRDMLKKIQDFGPPYKFAI